MLKSFRSYLRRLSNGFVLALCIALTITLIAVSLSAKSPFIRSSNLETEQIDEGSEYWAIFGHRLKITDTLLVAFTCALWFVTYRLVKTSKDAAERQLRAHVSGGRWRARIERESAGANPIHPLAYATSLSGGRFKIIEPVELFDIHINNHGQTPARLHHFSFGFFDAAGPVPENPPYGERLPHSDAIGAPENQSKLVQSVPYPAGRWARAAICGRFYWTDVMDRE